MITQVEAAGAIANIAFTDRSDHIGYLIDAGVVPVLIRLLSSGSNDVRTEVVRALDYIAGFNAEYRDMVLAAGVLPALLQAAEGLTDQLRVAIIRNIVQVICNLCRRLPTPPLSAVEPALPFLTRSLFSQDIKIVEQVCNIFEVLCAGGDNYIQAILQLGVTPRLVELVQNESIKLLLLLNTITGATDASQLQFLLNHKVLDHPDKDIMISAGDQLQAMIDGGIFPKLFEVLKEERGSIKKQGVIRLLCSLLQENFLEVVVVRMAVGGLEKILQRNKYDYDLLERVVKILCDESDGIQALERLKRNKDKRISKGAKSIVEAMFGKHLISEDSLNHLRSIQYYRQMLSINRNPPIQQVIDCGVVPCLIRFLQIDDNAALQVEAVGAISNIADTAISDHIGYLIDVGVVPVLIRLLTSGSDDVRAHVATALGHLGRGYNVEYRDRVLAAGALPALLQAAEDCKETLKQDVLAQISYALSCLSRGDTLPDIRPALPLLARLLSFQDEEIVYCVCLTLVNIALGPETYVDAILQEDLNIISRLMELFVGSTSTKILVPSLKALGNIAFGNERQTQSVLVALPSLLWLLDHPDKQIRVEVCFTLSNITGGTQDQIQAVIDAAIFPKVFEVLKSLDLEVQKEAVFVIANAIERGTIEQVWYLINEGVIPVLCNLLQDNRVNGKEILSSLWGILDAGKKRGRLEDVIRMVSDCDGQNKIEKLKKHKDLDTLILAGRIMNTFFH